MFYFSTTVGNPCTGKLPFGWLEQDAQRAGVHNDTKVEDEDTMRVQKRLKNALLRLYNNPKDETM